MRERERGEEHAEEEELEQSLERVALRSPLLPRFGPFVRRAPPLARLGMSALYLARDASMVVRRMTSETSVELKILTEKWQLLFAGLVFQYIHGLAARGVHYMHRPGPTLQDLGFMILPEVGLHQFIKMLAWCRAIAQSLLIIASRKHYSVDVVVAWYTVNLVVFFVDKKLTELPDRSVGSTSVLPVSMKEKDSKLKEDKTKLLNGNSVDSADWRPWTQMNGMHIENGNHHDTKTTKT